ncbi:hypothetical protein G3I32_26350 [Streptomyces coelicoflavus]|uniref:Uncharacterized protein n=1 Tax=Streptomyces coelicoflavus TaxID=285562 RepID=A0A7K3PQS8_9ACTN|nr:hypothetical protein [Streptomyces coelicoflavus]
MNTHTIVADRCRYSQRRQAATRPKPATLSQVGHQSSYDLRHKDRIGGGRTVAVANLTDLHGFHTLTLLT